MPDHELPEHQKFPEGQQPFDKRYPLTNLEEDRVFDEISLRLNLRGELNAGAL